ncbi:energy-coupling factor ABC transporter ATP-binding protein [Paenibacillus hexagrammi]|uniref:Energy-coupling factor ABC transporter ATP-binding protein n=1 Tax=Paenibacillus hexagrammi TaxID=2908839 RepID=A0ABY3SLU7_9BACL|nr:ABC transporter ATP-binding protein [Paenibacillus sp. YPD9-1]UJF34453.1 energy-coupling factor ABC transporter ATP-binding protein [Paenibacillus sp. YPD9-1]
MTAILEARGISYRYPGTSADALHELSLQIPMGKKTAICGHNGSGKSTFFLHTIGIHKPAKGSLLWKGSEISYKRESIQRLRRQIGLVFQDPEQQLILNTPLEDVSFGLRNAGVSEQEINERTAAILSVMGLSELSDTPIHQLSLGQKKRVALAGVLVLEPDLLILDEPTAYLDRVSEQQLIEELNRIHSRGIGMVMATHDMNLAYSWADWILVMDRGSCVLQGTPEYVFGRGDQLHDLGLELPMLLDLWRSLPEHVRAGQAPPRDLAAFKQLIEKL